MREVEFALLPDVAAPRRMRLAEFVGTETSDRYWVAELLLSELVTNVVRHARTAMNVRLRLSDAVLNVEVTDYSGTPLTGGAPVSEDVARGRGLVLLRELSERATIAERPGGKGVGFEIALCV